MVKETNYQKQMKFEKECSSPTQSQNKLSAKYCQQNTQFSVLKVIVGTYPMIELIGNPHPTPRHF